MKNRIVKSRWLLILSLIFILLSALGYTVNYLIFHNPHEMFFLMFEDIAFMFLDVLVVILLVERLLAQREKRMVLKKLNMVIGTFFSEVGLDLLSRFSSGKLESDSLRKELHILPSWSSRDFKRAASVAKDFNYDLKIESESLTEIKLFLERKRHFLVALLENPNLLEHERFTDVLWAVFHLAEELSLRKGELADLPPSDYQHLMNDAKRAYSHLTAEWIVYTGHLKESYPYLFHLAVRMNPFNPDPNPVVK